jgi:hypothetical protein
MLRQRANILRRQELRLEPAIVVRRVGPPGSAREGLPTIVVDGAGQPSLVFSRRGWPKNTDGGGVSRQAVLAGQGEPAGCRMDQSEGRCKTYWHQPSDTVILLPAERPRTAVREADLASVRVHLAGRGVLDEKAFAEFVRTGLLPLGSPS